MKHWISAFRLRTLPLALSSIIGGSFILLSPAHFDMTVFVWACVTTILLQITSNLANDLGDGLKGTDNDQRIGPQRAVQSGAITIPAMKRAVLLFVVLSLVSGITLLYFAFTTFNILFFILLIIGLAAIGAAIKYTYGKFAYGYSGLGDLFVFIFFGGVGVIGSYFLQTQSVAPHVICMAFHIGFLSMAVLNLNNIRDIENDKNVGKMTIVVKMGLRSAKIYHIFLVTGSFIAVLLTSYYSDMYIKESFFLLGIPYLILFQHLLKIPRVRNPRLFDPELKKVAIATLISSICVAMHFIY